jgi:hypothetical protein
LDILILDFGLVSDFVLRISNFAARKNREQNVRFRVDNGLTRVGSPDEQPVKTGKA